VQNTREFKQKNPFDLLKRDLKNMLILFNTSSTRLTASIDMMM